MRLPILDKLEKELMASKKELEVDIPKALKTATDMGDLSENAEYKAAKERQMFLQSRVSQLQKRIGDIISIDLNRIPKDRSGLGSTLVLKHVDSGAEKKFFLVFPEEVDPELGKISMASPIGKRLAGKMEGDEIEVPVEGETQSYEVVQIITIHQENG
ncbi:MAG: transcription elongation factor GreA [Nitrospina sp.]|nr:GreA/GreB family elongation factor [Nitrospinota bacterium]TDJ53766.1 MAG: transcription elongation factor GreA [Nitrospina sp.]TDJ61394.1 MAG: transcription elongation factor GreA [Nitrospina sp.]